MKHSTYQNTVPRIHLHHALGNLFWSPTRGGKRFYKYYRVIRETRALGRLMVISLGTSLEKAMELAHTIDHTFEKWEAEKCVATNDYTSRNRKG